MYFSDINEDALNKLPEILSHYEKNQYEIGFHDVASEESWTNILNKVDAKFNRLNILLNSAGIALGGDVVSTGFDVWKKVHDVNLDSIFLGCKLAIPMMSIHGAGSIISISSISGIVAGWNTAAYNSSKAGVRHLSKSVALYCAKKGYNIRSNTIHPAFVDTPILDPHKQAFGEEEAIAKLSRQIPMNKIGDTDDVFKGQNIKDNSKLERRGMLAILQQHSVKITIPIRSDLTVGQIVKLNIPEPEILDEGADTEDKINDNRYLITDLAIHADPLGGEGVLDLECVKESYAKDITLDNIQRMNKAGSKSVDIDKST